MTSSINFKFCWFILCLYVSISSSTTLNCGKCLWGSSLICPSHDKEQFKVEIKNYVERSIQYMHVTCNLSSEVNFSLLEGCSFASVNYIRFYLCPFTNESLANVLNRVKVRENKIEYLDINYSYPEITTLYPHHLLGLSNLTYLSLEKTFLDKISEDAFQSTPNLKTLYIKGNNLGTLGKNTFKGLTALTELNLSHNNLSSLPEGLFDDQSRLKSLYFWTNDIEELPPRIFDNLISLQNFSFVKSNLKFLDSNLFKNNIELSTVNFKDNKLTKLPPDLFKNCSELISVKFTQNNLETLPENIFQFNSKLRKIEFSKNIIENLRASLLNNLSLLEYFDFSNNRLQSLPPELFASSRKLTEINLSNNFIKEIPYGFLNYTTKLKTLYLTNNSLVTLPDDLFINCISLEELFLSKNKLTVLRFNSFPKSDDSILRIIDLSFNNLTVQGIIPNYVFALNTQLNLENINLSYNKFSDFPVQALFFNFLKLKQLNFEGNFIKGLLLNDIFDLANNTFFNLKNNRIEKMGGKVIAGNKRINVFLEGNNFTCDCYIYEMIKMIQNSDSSLSKLSYLTIPFEQRNLVNQFTIETSANFLNVVDKEKLRCHRPISLVNQSLTTLDLFSLTCSVPTKTVGCSGDCPCTYRPHDNMFIVECGNRNLNTTPGVEYYNSKNYTLDLSGNRIKTFNFSLNAAIVELNLANNNLTSEDLKSNTAILPPTLKFLNLRNNNLTHIEEDFLKQVNLTKTEIDLTNNPWVCNCDIKELHIFIQAKYSKVRNIRNILCTDKAGEHGEIPLMDLSKEELCPLLLQPMVITTIGVITVLLVLFAILGTVSFYRYKTRIKVWLFTHRMCLWLVTENELDVDKQYDAFISYSHKDEEFVNTILVPGLENGDPKYRVCLHYRDWVVGEFIQNQILNSVQNSRRTLVILSTNFIESVWGQMEFKAAHQQALQDKTNRVIVIVYGQMPPEESLDEELLHYVKMHTYLKWGDPRFWESLRYAMPHPKHLLMKKKNKKKNGDKLELVNGHISKDNAIRV